MIATGDSLILKGDETIAMSLQEKAPEECNFHSEETLALISMAEGIWRAVLTPEAVDYSGMETLLEKYEALEQNTAMMGARSSLTEANAASVKAAK